MVDTENRSPAESPLPHAAFVRRLLVYDGRTYRIAPSAVEGLLEHAVIEVDPADPAAFVLGRDHVIEELEPHATLVEIVPGELARHEQQLEAERVLAGLGFGL